MERAAEALSAKAQELISRYALDRLVRTTDALGAAVDRGYDPRSLLTSEADQLGLTRRGGGDGEGLLRA